MLASPPSLYKTSRLNAYIEPGGYTKLARGLESFVTAQCSTGLSATLNGPGDLPGDLYERIQLLAMGGAGIVNTDDVPTPPCRDQARTLCGRRPRTEPTSSRCDRRMSGSTRSSRAHAPPQLHAVTIVHN